MKPDEAIIILEALMDGIDPITGEVLPADHLCQEKDVLRALHTAILFLQKSIPERSENAYPYTKNGKLNAGRPWTKSEQKQLTSLYLDQIELDEICRILQRRRRGVLNQLEQLGLLDGQNAPSDKRGMPWTRADHEWLMKAWEDGRRLDEMANYLGRTTYAVRLRLEKEGLYPGGMTKQDEPPAWTKEDDAILIQMVDEGRSLSEMAEHFCRTEKAMEVRLFYKGLIKQPPKLFGQ